MDRDTHEALREIITDTPLTLSGLLEGFARNLVTALKPVSAALKSGDEPSALALLQLFASNQSADAYSKLHELTEEIHTKTVTAPKAKVKAKK